MKSTALARNSPCSHLRRDVCGIRRGNRSGELVRSTWFSVTLLLQGYVSVFCSPQLSALASATPDRLRSPRNTHVDVPSPGVNRAPAACHDLFGSAIRASSSCSSTCVWGRWPQHARRFRAVVRHGACRAELWPQQSGLHRAHSIPGPFPLLTGLKIAGLLRGTLIAAELVFGASGGDGGLGWYISA